MLKPFMAALALLLSCSPPPPAGQSLWLTREPVPGGVRLLLLAEPGARISAEYTPTLTLEDGIVVRFDTTALSPDSAYFAAPPSATLARPPAQAHGLLKASVCHRNEAVCRLVKLEV
jgi:hypothetical protein